jgi:UDP-N-acetylglucosamine:LPS N-acetylglucosamine transferase
LTDRGAAVLVRDDRAVAELGSTVLRLIKDRDALDRLRTAIAGLGANNAAEVIAAEVIRLGYKTMDKERNPVDA